MTTQHPLVAADLDDGVLTLTLGRAPAHPLSLALIEALHGALDAAAENPQARVVVLSGPGHIFCAGHDLKEIAAHRQDPDQGHAFLTQLFDACAQMMQRLASLPQPTIAMVDGIATAAGLQMAASCDLVFASDRASFCLPGVNNGGFCTTPIVGVSRAISRRHVMELALSGQAMDAQWALQAGLINRIFTSNALGKETIEFAKTLASRNPGPIAAGKAALDAHLGLPLDQAYAMATPVMIGHFMDEGRLAAEHDSKFG